MCSNSALLSSKWVDCLRLFCVDFSGFCVCVSFSDWLSNVPSSLQLFHTLESYGKNEQLRTLGSVTLSTRNSEKLDNGRFRRFFSPDLLLLVVACCLVVIGC